MKGRRALRDKLGHLVKAAFEVRKGRSGAVGLTFDFEDQGHRYNRKTVTKSMQLQGLVAASHAKGRVGSFGSWQPVLLQEAPDPFIKT